MGEFAGTETVAEPCPGTFAETERTCHLTPVWPLAAGPQPALPQLDFEPPSRPGELPLLQPAVARASIPKAVRICQAKKLRAAAGHCVMGHPSRVVAQSLQGVR